MTLDEAKKILSDIAGKTWDDVIRDGLSLAQHDPKDIDKAMVTVLDYLNEGLPGRTVHELKLGWNFCDPVLSGRKTFELRKNDRGFQTGDLIRFVPVRFDASDVSERFPEHPIQKKLYEITYILNGWGMTTDCVALAIREVET